MKLRPVLVLLMALAVTGTVHADDTTSSGAACPSPASATPDINTDKAPVTLKPTTNEAEAALLSARFLTKFHYQPKPLDDAMSEKIFDKYVKSLDSEKVFFTQADMDHFKSLRTGLDDAIWNEDLSGPFAMFNLYVRRATDRMNYAIGLLGKGFDFSKKESYEYDRDKAAWPKDQAALNDLWRKRVKNDWLRLKLAGQKPEKIRQTLSKRYKGYISRLQQLDSQDAFQTFMNAYAETTDPHTDYFGPRAAENFDIAMRLSLEGIGAVLQARDEYTQIREVVPGGPAAKSGQLHVGDRIVAVGQGEHCPMEDVVGWRLDDVVDKIRGKKNTTVRLEVIPAAAGLDGKHKTVTLVRKKVSIEEQAAKKKLIKVKEGDVTRKIGIIDLPTFYQDFDARRRGDPNYKSASRDVAKLIGELKADGVDGIIVDLRNNGGGSLSEAVALTGLFIHTGPVVQVRSSNGNVDEEKDDNPGIVWKGPLAVLVNRGSASASEIFTAAIKDYGRGLIIGDPTFGKGTVQNLVNLDRFANSGNEKPSFGELKMTIAQFFRINGGSTQLRGVKPDIQFPKNGDEKDFGESTYDNALPWTHISPSPGYKPLADVKPLVPLLEKKHEQRVTTSKSWKLMLDELAEYKKNRAKTELSLNYATREAERKHYEALQKEFKARHKAIDGDADDTLEVNLDDGLQPGERSLKQELKDEKEAKSAKDVYLDEAAHILADEVGLIKDNTKLAAEVLPYGEHFDKKAFDAISKPAKQPGTKPAASH
ncbi:carboxy terminal-processing peptidase [Oleiagrimonas sp. C23AA]|uniref:carboxy terminal-processing peptidase n=1 Tax=Oleiagrimonas sp. C23AA TaxID=2719047 RepID=UPI001420BC0F|nr:carboxy terminal-processing peptidase [Oleiagrimonas sp. C23AA]NII09665.1 carboxy terminal-processing peptidase [Oleiagrimonas sp. C23AA]